MKVIVVYIGEILHCPPALSLVQILGDLEIETILCTIGSRSLGLENNIGNIDKLQVEFVGETYDSKINLVKKFFRMYQIKRELWKVIERDYVDGDIVWVVSEGSLKHLGKKLLERDYILHLLELNEGIYFISGNPILKLDYKRYAKEACVLVEAEYNRAHITKAWWELDVLPAIFPNKPYNVLEIERNAEITSSSELKMLMEKLKDKKIILYQGNISKERPLQEYIKAVGELGEEYAFVMMINGDNPYPELKFDNFYCVPFVCPPFHLEVTSRAFIGILSYVPIKNDYSILNTLYCAPNKVWEYAKFGVPMIGNDLPALRQLFLEFGIGKCIKTITKEEIKAMIKCIEHDYETFSASAKKFFDSADLREITEDILKQAKNCH